jgi:hypothetical protein
MDMFVLVTNNQPLDCLTLEAGNAFGNDISMRVDFRSPSITTAPFSIRYMQPLPRVLQPDPQGVVKVGQI